MLSFLRQRWVRIGLSGIVLAAALTYAGLKMRTNWAVIHELDWNIDYRWFPVAGALYLINLLIFIMLWHRMMVRVHPGITLRDDVQRYTLANLPKYLPTIFWYVAGRIHLYEQIGVKRSMTFTLTMLEVLLHATAGALLYSSVRIITAPNVWQQCLWGSLLIALLTVLGQPQLLTRFGAHIKGWSDVRQTLASTIHGADLLRWCFGYLLTWIIGCPFLLIVARAFPESSGLGIIDVARIWSLVGIVDYLASWTLGGLAFTRDITLSFLLGQIIPLPVAIAIAATLKIILMLCDLTWNIVLLSVARLFGEREFSMIAQTYDTARKGD